MKQSERELDSQFRALLAADRKAAAAIVSEEHKHPGIYLMARNCPVCGNSNGSGTITNGCFTYAKCSNCSLLYMNPCLKDELVSEGFTDDDPENKEYWSLVVSKSLVNMRPKPDPLRHRILRDIFPIKNQGRLLDVGCSNGDFLQDAAHFYSVEGLEINDRTAGIARAKGFTIHTCPIEELPTDILYDVITFNQLLYGLKNPLHLFKEAIRLLKPGGILYINTPHSDSLAMTLYQGRHCHILWKADLNVFNKKSLATAAGKAGFNWKIFYTEWTNLYIIDILTYIFFPGKFVHRRNSFFPFYRKICAMEEFMQNILIGNRFKRIGDYCVCILAKDWG